MKNLGVADSVVGQWKDLSSDLDVPGSGMELKWKGRAHRMQKAQGGICVR